MNTPTDAPNAPVDHPATETPDLSATAASSCQALGDYVRHHPCSTLLAAVGLGFATVLVVKAMTPPPR
ncbi:MAG: hypothetical protein ACOYOF_11430, partial [Verrucomicrobiaceae bacterium]